jgi:4-hydroxymandelate oxidase
MNSGSTRRRALLGGLAGTLAGSSLLRAQQDPKRDHTRIPGLDELTTVQDFEPVAFAKLTHDIYSYTAHGDSGEVTLRRNREAFNWVELVPRGAIDPASVQTATEILGTKLAFPLMAAPTASHAQLHRDGELATHRATTAASNTPMIVSNAASFPMDKIADAATGPLWFQLYPRQDLDGSKDLLDTALTAGSKAVVMTVDQQASYYERSEHNRHMNPPPVARMAGRPQATRAPQANPYRVGGGRLWYNWKYVDDIRKMLTVPLLAKGILTAEDAKLCVEHGLNGIIVSNHGGRSLDYDPSTLEVLPEIVDAVQGRIPVIVDSGFRTGTDMLKALALGAKAVCVGRGVRWGLASFGMEGVQKVLQILQSELVMAMAQTGMSSLASIDRTLVRTHFR